VEGERPYGYVYLIRNTVNGKVYVGQTVTDVATRWQKHLVHRHEGGRKYPLYLAIRKHGPDVFSVTTLATAQDQTELDLKERILIRAYRAMSSCGYNCRAGGYSGGHLSEETKAKIGAANIGRSRTPETRERIGAASRGREQSEATRAKRSAKAIGRKMPPRTAEHIEKIRRAKLGTKQSPETIERRAAAHRGRKNTPETIEKMRMAALNRRPGSIENMRIAAVARVARNGGVAVIRVRPASQPGLPFVDPL
jgi:group I intron endonuclease